MTRWWRWPLLVTLVGVIAALLVYYFVAVPLDGSLVEYGVGAAFALISLVWVIPGLVVLMRSRWHIVGWVMVGMGFMFAFPDSPEAWDPNSAAYPWAAWVSSWVYDVGFTVMIVLLTVFPDGLGGRPPRERAWGRVRIIVPTAMCLLVMLQETVASDTFGAIGANPTGVGFVPRAVASWHLLPVVGMLIASAVSLWRRSRRADRSVRQQYTWVLFPFALMLGYVAIALPLAGVVGEVIWVGSLPFFILIPIAFSIAMVRYHWFDIDRIVSRTVSYGAVALVIAAVYAVPVVVLPDLLGLSSDLSVALATLAAAALFSPLRRRVQTFMDRRFDRERYDTGRLVEGFSGRLQTAVDLGTVSAALGGVVTGALRPTAMAVWFADPVTVPERSGGRIG